MMVCRIIILWYILYMLYRAKEYIFSSWCKLSWLSWILHLGCHGNITLVRVIKLSLWFCKMKIHVFLWQTIDKIKAIFSFLSMCNASKLYSWKLARIKMLITSMWLNYSVTIATVLNFENPNVFNDNSAS